MKFVIGDLDNVNKHCNEKNGEHFNTPHIEYWTFDESNDSDRDGTHFVSFDDSGINCIIFSFFPSCFVCGRNDLDFMLIRISYIRFVRFRFIMTQTNHNKILKLSTIHGQQQWILVCLFLVRIKAICNLYRNRLSCYYTIAFATAFSVSAVICTLLIWLKLTFSFGDIENW